MRFGCAFLEQGTAPARLPLTAPALCALCTTPTRQCFMVMPFIAYSNPTHQVSEAKLTDLTTFCHTPCLTCLQTPYASLPMILAREHAAIRRRKDGIEISWVDFFRWLCALDLDHQRRRLTIYPRPCRRNNDHHGSIGHSATSTLRSTSQVRFTTHGSEAPLESMQCINLTCMAANRGGCAN